MRGRSSVALLTLLTFTTLTWSNYAHAQSAPPTPPPSEAPPPPPATPPSAEDATMAQAKQHFETGRNAYNAGDYVTAIREFKQAESMRPSPILDYNIGLGNEKLGKRRVAVKYYKRYLEEQPNASNRAEVQGKVTALEAEIAANPGTSPAPGQPPTAQQEQPGDMPPVDPNVAAAQPGYDPYAGTAPPGQPVAVKPVKKKSLWWIWLIIGGAVTLTVVIAVVIYVYAVDTTIVADDHALTATTPPTGGARYEHPDFHGKTLLRF
ncbi:MAG TPA: tetratricopeptide repeat protein [Polyangia bacterium]|jgi:tetratricopeptide (TPR) repeat protein